VELGFNVPNYTYAIVECQTDTASSAAIMMTGLTDTFIVRCSELTR